MTFSIRSAARANRREFVFTSLKAAALLSPVLSIRRAEAQAAPPPPLRVFFWVSCQGYADPSDFFPTSTGPTSSEFAFSPMLGSFEGALRDYTVVVDGVNIAETGYDNGNNHVRTMGKVLTAHDIQPNPNEEGDGLPGDISIDQLLARDLGMQSLEILVDDRDRGDARCRPFALGPGTSKAPFVEANASYQRVFADFNPLQGEEERQRKLRRKRSILDDLTRDLSRLRGELVGIERVKLDVHEDALRRTEQSVQRDIDNAPAQCDMGAGNYPGSAMNERGVAQLDVMYSAFACGRVQLGAMCWGSSGYHWPYQWVPGVDVVDTIHDEVHHRDGERRDSYRRAATWDWDQVALFAERLRSTPEGAGNMLDNTLIVALSHFGRHHSGHRIPVALIGGAQGRLLGGRYVQLASEVDNSQLLTSVAHLANHPIAGFGDAPNCGPLAELS